MSFSRILKHDVLINIIPPCLGHDGLGWELFFNPLPLSRVSHLSLPPAPTSHSRFPIMLSDPAYALLFLNNFPLTFSLLSPMVDTGSPFNETTW